MLAGTYSEITGIPKSFNKMSVNDFALINRYFKFLKEGNFHQKMEKSLAMYDKLKLKHRHHLQFPLANNREMMVHDAVFLPSKGYFQTTDGAATKARDILKPTWYGDVLQNWIGRMQDISQGKITELNNKYVEDLRFLNQLENQG